MNTIREMLIFLLARTNHWPLIKFTGKIASAWVKGIANSSYNSALNGEKRALRIIGEAGAEIIFDVGANIGDWSLEANKDCSHAKIYAFELSPQTFRELQRNTAGIKNISAQAFGLSSSEGEVDFFHYPNNNVHSSLNDNQLDFEKIKMSAVVRTGDQFCQSQNISKIDLLKIDAEGADYQVLLGFESMLRCQKISAIQFEYGPPNLYSGHLLRHFYDLLGQYGYCIGKIYPHTVTFGNYQPQEDNFFGGNFMAVHQSKGKLIRRLSGQHLRTAYSPRERQSVIPAR